MLCTLKININRNWLETHLFKPIRYIKKEGFWQIFYSSTSIMLHYFVQRFIDSLVKLTIISSWRHISFTPDLLENQISCYKLHRKWILLFLQIKEEHYEIKLQVHVELITKLKSELFVYLYMLKLCKTKQLFFCC